MTVVAIMKQEHRFLQEWLDYHIGIGINRFVLYVNDKPGSEPYVFRAPDGVSVELIPWITYPPSVQQTAAYSIFCRDNPGEAAAFIDLDEFITVNGDFAKTLPRDKLLSDAAFDYFGGRPLALSWMIFGASGHVQSPGCGVLEAYAKQCPPRANYNFKTALRASPDTGWKSAHRPFTKTVYDTDLNIVPGFNAKGLYDKVYIRHYITKSWEDWQLKLQRGLNAYTIRDNDLFFELNPELLERRAELEQGVCP